MSYKHDSMSTDEWKSRGRPLRTAAAADKNGHGGPKFRRKMGFSFQRLIRYSRCEKRRLPSFGEQESQHLHGSG